MLKYAKPGGTFLLNSLYGPDEVWDQLPREVQKDIIEKKLKFYVINGYDVAEKTGMGGRINTIMQTCFFAISGVLPREEAIAEIKTRHREDLRQARRSRCQAELRGGGSAPSANLHEVKVPASDHQPRSRAALPVPAEAPEFVQQCARPDHRLRTATTSPYPPCPMDGTFPTGTTQWEKRNIALEIPVWETRSVHPVRQVRDCLPARGHPPQGV
ncbi:MAG: 2-oxoacid:acceptor oxidoreductase family protein [Ignavibacteriales bacterium]|nr:2-oxoacid:acceptor oxidoreductase family protein [Ignavibacteriales bacterium]